MADIFKIKTYKSFVRNHDGVTAIEYGLIAVALSILVVTILYGNPNGFIWAVTAKFEQFASLVTSVVLK